jgi:5-formyltetrahydrofolate cyclo-ligase
MSDAKNLIRTEALRHRQNLQIDPEWADQAANCLLAAIDITPDDVVALYYPKGKEMDTIPLAEKIWEKGATCALPVIHEGRTVLSFAQWKQGTDLIEGAFQIPQPTNPQYVAPTIVIIPLLVFDQRGNRLGYGKGYYDATLADLRQKGKVLAVGLAYAEQACLFALPAEDHDQKLDVVVTQQRVFDFRS